MQGDNMYEAVRLRNACKSYGRGANILDHLNLTVHRGTIYGLLGPSGCGKTTLLGCVVGLLELNKGYVTVFGYQPGSWGSGVPGPLIGYMPQEVALVDEFDVKGALYYFGWLFGMSSKAIAERYQFLSKLLQLPPSNQLIKNLSGGQQRRVSFAAALIQRPELLILDEPTVGLDPVLRQTIWDYLVEISRDYKTTIIITTHYIEEANQAHKIGLLRDGSLLAEASPQSLLAQFNTLSLEHVFLTLSQRQTAGKGGQPIITQEQQSSVQEGSDVESGQHVKLSIDLNLDKSSDQLEGQNVEKNASEHVENHVDHHVDQNVEHHVKENVNHVVDQNVDHHVEQHDNEHVDQVNGNVDHPVDQNIHQHVDHTAEQGIAMVELNKPQSQQQLPAPPPLYRQSTIIPMKALLYKNFTRILNTYGGLFFLFVFPLLEICIFFTAIGKDPKGLPLGIVNDELGNCNLLDGDLEFYSGVRYSKEEYSCEFFGLSCLLMDMLDDGTTVQIYYDSVEEARAATVKGTTGGMIHIPADFSQHLEEKVRDGKDASNETLVNSEIGVWLDMSDFTGLELRRHLFKTYFDFAEVLAGQCHEDKRKALPPIRYFDPIHGTENPSYTLYLAPGIMISLVFFLSTTLTISVVSIDRIEKSWDRDLVAGVTSIEIVISHLLTQCVCVVIQMTEALCLGFFVFDMHCHGSVMGLLVLIFIQGLSGVAFGMVISIASRDLTTAAFVGMGSFYPFILLSGMLWPLEGMPSYLRYISECLPNTWATTALRNILDRGWGVLHPQVFAGFLVPAAWIVGQSVICIGLLHFAKK